MIRCACDAPECKTKIRFDPGSSALWFTDKDGHETLMYLHPNAIRELVNELRHTLEYMVFGEGH